MFRQRLVIHLIFILWVSALFLSGCAAPPFRPTQISDGGTAESCTNFFASLDQQIAKAGVKDAGTFRLKDYPYLRSSRFLASFREDEMDGNAFSAWVDHMQALDQEARGYEIANLPATDAPDPASVNNKDTLNGNVVTCGNLLKAKDFQGADPRIEALQKRVAVPDEYSLLFRTIGFYPLFRVFVSMGVDNWHANAEKSYSTLPPSDGSSI